MSLPEYHQRSLTMFASLIMMLAAAVIAMAGALVIHKAYGDELQAPQNAWVIIGEVRGIDDPTKFIPLGPYSEDESGQPAKSPNGAHKKYFQSQEDCEDYLKTDKLKKFVEDVNAHTMRWHPPGVFTVWCSLPGDPV